MQSTDLEEVGSHSAEALAGPTPSESDGHANRSSNCHPTDWVRWIAYPHLLAVAICLSFTLADRGLFINHNLSRFVENYCGVLVAPALLGILLFPLAMLFLLFTGRVTGRSAALGFVVELVLTFAHMIVLLPAVQ